MGAKTFSSSVTGRMPASGWRFSRTAPCRPPPPGVTFHAGKVRPLVESLAGEVAGNIWLVGGGRVARTFLEEGLLDEIRLFLVPLLLGDGIPLFPPPLPGKTLTLLGVQQYPTGLVEVRYKVTGAPELAQG